MSHVLISMDIGWSSLGHHCVVVTTDELVNNNRNLHALRSILRDGVSSHLIPQRGSSIFKHSTYAGHRGSSRLRRARVLHLAKGTV